MGAAMRFYCHQVPLGSPSQFQMQAPPCLSNAMGRDQRRALSTGIAEARGHQNLGEGRKKVLPTVNAALRTAIAVNKTARAQAARAVARRTGTAAAQRAAARATAKAVAARRKAAAARRATQR